MHGITSLWLLILRIHEPDSTLLRHSKSPESSTRLFDTPSPEIFISEPSLLVCCDGQFRLIIGGKAFQMAPSKKQSPVISWSRWHRRKRRLNRAILKAFLFFSQTKASALLTKGSHFRREKAVFAELNVRPVLASQGNNCDEENQANQELYRIS